MSFASDVQRFKAKLERREAALHQATVDIAFQSIVEGSHITGAPGQPVDTGALRASWQRLPLGPKRTAIVTNLDYAPVIEDGVGRFGALVVRSEVGGFHSVKLTRAGWARIVEAALRQVPDA